MVAIVNCSFFTHAGQYHTQRNMPNEDCIYSAALDHVVSAAVCDGAGTASEGSAAARLISRLVSDYLCLEFKNLYYCDIDSTRRKLAQLINEHLKSYASEQHVEERQLATTILAAAMDDAGHCISIHLGDGIILQRKSNEANFTVVSSPRNGLSFNTTYLTMNCNLWQNLRVHRWAVTTNTHLLLMSDGAMSHLVCRSLHLGWHMPSPPGMTLRNMEDWLKYCEPMDDYSCVMLSWEQTRCFDSNSML